MQAELLDHMSQYASLALIVRAASSQAAWNDGLVAQWFLPM
jgi:hypothetical protein